jgi:hypothetical protein
VVEEAWGSGEDVGVSFKNQIEGVAWSLKEWSMSSLGDLEKQLKAAKKELDRWRRAPLSDGVVGREAVCSFKVDRLEEQVDTYWKQRAHTNWLQFGDRNTSFFHHACSERKGHNHIGNLKKNDGSWIEEEEEKKRYIINHFVQLFRSSLAENGKNGQQVLDVVAPRVTTKMNELLTADFTAEKVKKALDAIGDLRAPRPDGMPAILFKEYWDVFLNDMGGGIWSPT